VDRLPILLATFPVVGDAVRTTIHRVDLARSHQTAPPSNRYQNGDRHAGSRKFPRDVNRAPCNNVAFHLRKRASVGRLRERNKIGAKPVPNTTLARPPAVAMRLNVFGQIAREAQAPCLPIRRTTSHGPRRESHRLSGEVASGSSRIFRVAGDSTMLAGIRSSAQNKFHRRRRTRRERLDRFEKKTRNGFRDSICVGWSSDSRKPIRLVVAGVNVTSYAPRCRIAEHPERTNVRSRHAIERAWLQTTASTRSGKRVVDSSKSTAATRSAFGGV